MVKAVLERVSSSAHARETLTPLSAIRKRAAKVSNLWIFDSPKNNRRLTVSGDVPFMHLMLLEGDTGVAGYELVDDPFKVASNSDAGYVRVRSRDGAEHWIVIARSGRSSSGKERDPSIPEGLREKALSAGVEVHVRSELELLGKEVFLDNWLMLCAIMTRVKAYPTYRETELFLALMSRHGALRVQDVLADARADRSIMLAVVARALQEGTVHTDLTRRLFGTHSQLDRVRS